jgi:hypothetical protein
MKAIGRELGQLALKASMAHLDGEEGAIELAWLLAAGHAAFFNGGTPQMRKRLAGGARRLLAPTVHKDDHGFATYSGGSVVVPLNVGAKRIHLARYLRDRLQILLDGRVSRARLLNNLVGLVENVWPVPGERIEEMGDRASAIGKAPGVAGAIKANNAEALLVAVLRAKGVQVSKDLFSADDKKLKRRALGH